MEICQDGKPNNNFGQHLNQSIRNIPDLLSLYNAKQEGTNALMGPESAFLGWDVNARYEDGSIFQEKMVDYKRDAIFFRTMLSSLLVSDGV